ncbi:hypothetical protein Tco_0774316 [Tanacetum coccineum]|uniref:CRAL-TRIO domain-containing protein n=1 Tax=Tanacetum coccineum TaxID=301880 RepID=A0ABQ4ZN87_9ASTR
MAMVENLKELIQKDKLTIVDLEGAGLEKLKQQYKNNVELEYYIDQLKSAIEALNGIHHWEDVRQDFFKAEINNTTPSNVYFDKKIILVVKVDVKRKWVMDSSGCGNARLTGRDWNNKDVKRSKETVDKIDQVMKHREQLRRLEEYVGGRPKTIDPRSYLPNHMLTYLNKSSKLHILIFTTSIDLFSPNDMLYYLKIKKTFDLTTMIVFRMGDVKKNSNSRMAYVMILTRLYKYILKTNPQSIVPFYSFMYHERVMNPLDISRKTIKDKGKRVAPPSSSSSSSSNEDKEPSFLQFYEDLSDDEDLTDAQKDKRGMFKCMNRYFVKMTKFLKKLQ